MVQYCWIRLIYLVIQTKQQKKILLVIMENLEKAGETRSELLENLLCTEIFQIPQSLSANQYSLYHSTKPHVISQFRTISKSSFHLTKSGIVIELSMLLRKKRVSRVKSFEDYARFIYHVILKSAEPYRIFDIVTDRYFSESLKQGFRHNRGSDGLIFPFNYSTPFPANFETDFLTNITNEINLNEYLTQNSLSFMIMINRRYVLYIMTQSFQTMTISKWESNYRWNKWRSRFPNHPPCNKPWG